MYARICVQENTSMPLEYFDPDADTADVKVGTTRPFILATVDYAPG